MTRALTYVACILIAAAVAWTFGTALADVYPDGLLVWPPEGNAPPIPSDSFHLGLGIGWFFTTLCYSVMALSAWLAGRFTGKAFSVPLAPLALPLGAAAGTCLVLLLAALYLAG